MFSKPSQFGSKEKNEIIQRIIMIVCAIYWAATMFQAWCLHA